jgi:phosphoribosyl 1,2-cyclic phosphodiesterase
VKVHYCGVRGSTPAPGIEFARYGGNTPCLALTRDGEPRPSLILDAGTGLQQASALMGDHAFHGTILLTHLHWDHVTGLPFYAAGDDERARVNVLLPEQESGSSATDVLAGMMSPPYFPIGPAELRGTWSFGSIEPGERKIEGFAVLACEIPHKGGRTFGYRIGDGHASIAYMPDHCPTALGPGEDGLGAYHPAALQLARDVDVLIHDAQLLGPEQAREAAFGHAFADYAVALGARAGAREVVLFHHGHTRTDVELDALALRFGDDGAGGRDEDGEQDGPGGRRARPHVSVAREGAVTGL